jgi:methyl-accepting chemotaxis protein
MAYDEPEAAEECTTGAVSAVEDRERLERAMDTIGARVGSLSVSIADTAGAISDVAAALAGQADDFHDFGNEIRQMANSNHTVAEAAGSAARSATATQAGLSDTTQSIHSTLALAVDDIKAMATSASQIAVILKAIRTNINETQGFSDEIRSIATQTQMLAINAGIMAAHAGDAGRGFAVIADSVKQLADKTGTVTRNIVERLDALSEVVHRLQDQNTRNEEIAGAAYDRSLAIDGEMARFAEFGKAVTGMIDDIREISAPVETNIRICDTVLSRMSALDDEVHKSSERLAGASRQIDGLVSFGEDLIGYVADSGIETEDSPLIRHCIAAAEEIGRLFEAEIAAGRASLAELFDETYRPVPGSNPKQVTTAFTRLTDRLLPPIQEPTLEIDERVVFCAALDRNGYLPTHNRKYSAPQTDDPVWNAANCRNRRIFDDRTGLAAGRNTRRFLLQTYRRDMGGGSFTLMKDLSAPIRIDGRHWGGLRIGYRV